MHVKTLTLSTLLAFEASASAESIRLFPNTFTRCQKSQNLIPLEQAEGRMIESVVTIGLERTQPEVLSREYLITPGLPFHVVALQQSLQNIKNLRILRSVEACITAGMQESVRIQIEVVEKYTTLPFVRVGGGGGTSFFAVGVVDTNMFGKYFEVNGQYENLNGAHSGVAWYRNNRFMGKHFRAEALTQDRTRILNFFDSHRTLEAAHTHTSQKVRLYGDKELQPWLTFGAEVTAGRDLFSFRNLKSEQSEANSRNHVHSPQKGFTTTIGLKAVVGVLNYEDYLVDGTQLEFTHEESLRQLASEFPFQRSGVMLVAYKLLPQKVNLALRLAGGSMNRDYLQHQFYIGGFQHIRGFLDNEFHGKHFWIGNAEIRATSLTSDWFILQNCFFIDAGDTAQEIQNLSFAKPQTPTSIGAGARFIFPRTARLNLRLDVAVPIAPRYPANISFGTQQFF